ncbi:MAG: DUF433 domain-containing protein [Deltaproteobacteria bacterium]|nr:DUF433 domain-containing protein [Deltaproteobacteria bacterium]
MGDETWRSRILVDPAVHHGDPCIRGTRVPVAVIVGSVADGDSIEEVLRDYPSVTREDVRAAMKFAAEAVSGFDFIPLPTGS